MKKPITDKIVEALQKEPNDEFNGDVAQWLKENVWRKEIVFSQAMYTALYRLEKAEIIKIKRKVSVLGGTKNSIQGIKLIKKETK